MTLLVATGLWAAAVGGGVLWPISKVKHARSPEIEAHEAAAVAHIGHRRPGKSPT